MARILLVEDDVEIRDVLGEALELEGHAVMTASNGRDALDVLRTERPDVVLLDLMMPVMDGWDFLLERERSGTAHDVPVIVMSAVQPRSAVQRTQGYFAKPFDLDELLAALKRLGPAPRAAAAASAGVACPA